LIRGAGFFVVPGILIFANKYKDKILEENK